MARFCAQCGARLDDGARFCSKCGAEAKDAPSGASIPEGDGVDEALRPLGGVADDKEPRGASDETMVVGPEATAVSQGFVPTASVRGSQRGGAQPGYLA